MDDVGRNTVKPLKSNSIFLPFAILGLLAIGCSKAPPEMAPPELASPELAQGAPEPTQAVSTQPSTGELAGTAEVNENADVVEAGDRDHDLTRNQDLNESRDSIESQEFSRVDSRNPVKAAANGLASKSDVFSKMRDQLSQGSRSRTATSRSPAPVAASPTAGSHLDHLPAGAVHESENGFATVEVYYATDRKQDPMPLSSYQVSGQRDVFLGGMGITVFLIGISGLGILLTNPYRKRQSIFPKGTYPVLFGLGCLTGCLTMGIVWSGTAHIEKHGVQYGSGRGVLTRGICRVTVPDSHQRGVVERPSLLRFEFAEDQTKHVVLTSAVELSTSDFHQRMCDRVAESDNEDLLVFIHGYNVDFQSAVQRTAQMSVDLPFTGVPVCYSWPSQGSLLGYTVDENNAAWTVPHLKRFLTGLAESSSAKSINVVSHSMGNRALTSAVRLMDLESDDGQPPQLDRIVLAAPDVDADLFRRDLAPSLLNVANQVTLYASSDDRALIASKKVHGHPRAGESGVNLVIVPGIETVDVSGIDLSLLGHSYYGDAEAMLVDLHEVIDRRLPASARRNLVPEGVIPQAYWRLANEAEIADQRR